jgi:hypothetical protein
MAGGVVHCVLNGGDLLGVFIRNLNSELVLQRHHQFHRIERVGAQVGDERLFVGDLRLLHTELLGNDLLDACFNITHRIPRRVVEQSIILAGSETGSGQAAKRACGVIGPRSRSAAQLHVHTTVDMQFLSGNVARLR